METINQTENNDDIIFQHLMQLGYCLECESNINYDVPAKLAIFEKTHTHLLVYKSIITSTAAKTVTIQIFSDKQTLINYFVPFFQLVYKEITNPTTSLFLILFKLKGHLCIIDNKPYIGGILNENDHNVMNTTLTLEIFNLKQEISRLRTTITHLEEQVAKTEIMNQLDTIVVSDSDDQDSNSDSDSDESDLTYTDSDEHNSSSNINSSDQDSNSDSDESDLTYTDSDSDDQDSDNDSDSDENSDNDSDSDENSNNDSDSDEDSDNDSDSDDEDSDNDSDSDDDLEIKSQGEVLYDKTGKLKYRWYKFSDGRTFRYYTSGKQKIYLNDLLESFNGYPAVTYPDGTTMHYKDGQLHGFEYLDEFGDIYQKAAIKYSNGKKEWYKHGILHREKGKPAIVHPNDQGEFFYVNGQLHREGDLPAVNVPGDRMEWYINGLRHRDLNCGPAVIHNDNTYEYWINGQFVSESTIYSLINRNLPKDSSEESDNEEDYTYTDSEEDSDNDSDSSDIEEIDSSDNEDSDNEEIDLSEEDNDNKNLALTLCLTYSDDKHKIYNQIFERLTHYYKKVLYQYMEFVYIPNTVNNLNNFVECFHITVNEAGNDEEEDKCAMISLFNPNNLEEIQSFFETIPSSISHLFINVTHQTLPLFCKSVETFSIMSLIDLE